MSAPQVYRAINSISAELAGSAIPKLHRNERDDYLYRSIDDVLNRLSPLLAKYKLCILPRVLDRTAADRSGEGDLLLVSVSIKVAFDLVSISDGSMHTVETYGEALDPSDKATAKAMSSAYKHAILQMFCVPVARVDDADRSSHRLKRPKDHQAEPVGGWQQWTADIIEMAESCASADALDRLQQQQRPLLTAISRERPDLYGTIGATFSARAITLNSEACASSRRAKAASTRGKRRGASAPKSHRAKQRPHVTQVRKTAREDQPRNDQAEISETA